MVDKLERAYCNKCGFVGVPDGMGFHERPSDGEQCNYLCRSFTSANGEQVERGPGLLDDGMCQEHGRWLCAHCLRGHTLVEEGEAPATPTEDATERAKVLEENEKLRAALQTAVDAIALYLLPSAMDGGIGECTALMNAKHAQDEARTALGNKETDRHG